MVPKCSELILVNGRAILKANTQAIGAASVKYVLKNYVTRKILKLCCLQIL